MIGQTVSHYRVLEALGAGGMGIVYKAEDIKLGRMVALKFLPADRTHDRATTERFLREARAASSLNHPHICTIYEVDEHEGSPFLAMELLEGRTLDRRIDGRPLEMGILLRLAQQIADGLDAAHARGVLHRDVKPANIFVTDRDQAKLLDFGLAKLTHDALGGGSVTQQPTALLSTRAGTAMGTVAYMSPEQARGEDLDARSDVFSFGVVLYEMATGQQTFQGGTTALVFDAILNRDPRAPIELNANVPVALERVIARALDKDRGTRYPSVAEMRDDLQRIARERESALDLVPATSGRVPAASRSSWPSATAMTPAVPVAAAPAAPTAVAAPPAPVKTARERRQRWLLLAPAVTTLVLAAVVFSRWMDGGNAPDPAPATTATTTTPAPPTEPAAPALSEVAPGATPAVAVAPPAPSTVPPAPTAAGTPVRPSGAAALTPRPGTPAPGARPAPGAPAVATTAAAAVPAEPIKPRVDVSARLKAAQAKFDSGLYDQALADAKEMVAEAPAAASAPAARLLIGRTLERQRKPDDAMAAYVELRSTHKTAPEAAPATLALAELVLRSRQRDRELTARTLLDEVITGFPASAEAPTALVRRASLEEKSRTRVMDKELATSVPPELSTYRTVVEKYPTDPAAEIAHEKLAGLYEDLRRYEQAAKTWESLAANFPKNQRDGIWRAAELYREKLKDPARARDAYARVPAGSSRFRDAQERLR